MAKYNGKVSQKHHKPFATRTPVLAVLLAVTLLLIGITEYAVRTIPVHYGFGKLDNVINTTLQHVNPRHLGNRRTAKRHLNQNLLPRQDSGTTSFTGSRSVSVGSGSSSSSISTPEIYSSVTGSGYVEFGDGTTTPPPAPGVTVTSTPTNTSPTPQSPVQTPSVFVPSLGTVNPTEPYNPNFATNGYISSFGDGRGSAPTATPTDPVPIVVVASGKTSTFTPTEKPTPTPTPGQIVPSVVVVSGSSRTISVTQQSVPVATPSLTVISGTTYTASTSSSVTVINGQSYTIIAVLSTSQNKATNVQDAVHPTATFVNATGTYLRWSNEGITRYPQISKEQYIRVAILPLVIAILYTVPWRILDSTIREMEPFYQLSKPEGATADKSLCLDYGSTVLGLLPFKSIFRGHFIVFWSSVVSIVVLLLAPLSSEALFVSLTGTCGPNLPQGSPPCHAAWAVYPVFARAIQGILAFIAVLVLLIMLFNFRRTSGIYSEPLSVAAIAALLYKSPLLKDLHNIDSKARQGEIRHLLAGKRFRIANFTATDNTPCYGIVPVNPDYEAGFATVPSSSKYINVNVNEVDASSDLVLNSTQMRIRHFWWSVHQNAVYVAALVLFAGLLALLSYYHWTSYDTEFEAFMNSSSFGVRLMMTTMGVVIRLIWGRIDSDLRKLEPYHRLLLGNAKPGDSILVPVYMSPLSAILPSLYKRHFLVALTCFVSFLSEFLPLFLANSIFSPAMTKLTYNVCTAFAIAILLLMIVTTVGLVLRPRRSVKPLPRRPGTLASVALYLASREDGGAGMGVGGGLLEGMRGLSVLGTKERNEAVKNLGALYSMGLIRGDGLRIDDDRRIGKLWSG